MVQELVQALRTARATLSLAQDSDVAGDNLSTVHVHAATKCRMHASPDWLDPSYMASELRGNMGIPFRVSMR
jgi:hypothetical protein